MTDFEELMMWNKAIDFAKSKHEGQFDKGGVEYFYHCFEAMKNVEKLTEKDVLFHKTVALLHDTLEDTDTTYEELCEEFTTAIADHVLLLTKKKGQSYFDYIDQLKYNEVCRNVKKADLLDNMDLTRLNHITIKDIERNEKYLKVFKILLEVESK